MRNYWPAFITNLSETFDTDRDCRFDQAETVTYKITRADAADSGAEGAYVTLNHSTELERQKAVFVYNRVFAAA